MSSRIHSACATVTADGTSEQCGRCWRPIPSDASHCPGCRSELSGAGFYDVFTGEGPSDLFCELMGEEREAA